LINLQAADSAIDLDQEYDATPGNENSLGAQGAKMRNADNLSMMMLDVSSAINNDSIVIMLNNDSMA
jgi:hypothetical protein